MSNLVFDGSLPAKRTICFPNLKILTMKRVTFSDDYSIQQLLSAPPLLEKLELHNCSWGDLKAVTISAPKLQYLSIREYVSIREYERRRSSNGDVCEVMVIYGKELVPQMPMFNNLMDLEFIGMSIDIHCATLLVLLQKFPCLKTLKFSEGIGAKSDGILNPVPPCFLSQLKCIKIDKYGGYDYELSAVKILLDNAIVLDEIVITCVLQRTQSCKKSFINS
ncbi:uncharacterized protein LOC132170101 [Corylus avellana]|uniref:uncharacterized protein LOC132170101 n=1 Tax=Corylus avellana TaxID=13451 RepID=UPI00286C3900|nr:uncharacterized protein LOC132170101 [Corylus avellana]